LETKTFAELGLSPKVQAAIDAAGYTTPTPIQAEAIPVALTGRDVLGIAQTGTGKTAGFVLPMITRLETGRARARMPRSLILAPTRELAAQVAQSFEKYGINHKLDLALLIGGVSMDDQVRKLDRGVDVLIATPGRLLDHFQRGRIMLMGVEILVIDEADRMLDMGFIPDIEKICKLLPPRRQTLFFSATMPPEITRLVNQFLKDPVRIEVAPPATTAKTITQRFVFCPNGEDWAKREALRDLIRNETVKNAIIFCNRKVEVAILHKSLVKHGFNAGALHGDMDQKSRTETLDRFRSGELMLLAASDVAARGLDIPDVSHIFNFDLPWQSDDYVHRIGRTGRAGKEGNSLSLVTADELKSLKDIEKMLGEPVVWLGEPPSEQDFAEAGKKRRRGRGGPQRGRAPAGRAHGKPRHGGESRHAEGRTSQRPPERQPAQAERAEQPRQQPRRPDPHRPDPRRDEQPRGEYRSEHKGELRAEGRPERQPHRAKAGNGQEHGQAAPPKPRSEERKRERPPQAPRQDSRQDARQGQGSGFADNVPAFLRKPVKRPVKVAGE
jgi:superfamily II DNA/RNA helicase